MCIITWPTRMVYSTVSIHCTWGAPFCSPRVGYKVSKALVLNLCRQQEKNSSLKPQSRFSAVSVKQIRAKMFAMFSLCVCGEGREDLKNLVSASKSFPKVWK